MPLADILWVAAGGAVGAALRFLLNAGALHLIGPGFPWGTLTVNIAGSFVMGLVAQVIIMRGGMPLGAQLFLTTGLLGGFTTFSAFSLDVAILTERGEMLAAAGYILITVMGAISALFAGQLVMRQLLGATL